MNKALIKQFLTLIFFVCLFSSLSAQNATLSSQKLTPDSTVKILAIGNSFSEDAMEQFLFDLAKAGGHKIIIGVLFRGASDLDLHWKNASGNIENYNYRKITVDGEKIKTHGLSTMESALVDERWDYISFQQVSNKSGLYETYLEPLPKLLSYVKERANNPNVKYIFHQTWAYKASSKNKKFESYSYSQKKMYRLIAKTSKKIKRKFDFDMLVPNGTAIQNARTSYIGDGINRDDFHLSFYLGRYTASCTWYEMIFKENVIGNTFYPEQISSYDAEIAQTAAHRASKNPYRVTELTSFKKTNQN